MSEDERVDKIAISSGKELSKQNEDVCKPTVIPRRIESDDPSLVYEPRVREISGSRLEILGKRDDPSIIPWGFWGGVMLLGLAVFMVLFRSGSGLGSIWEIMVFTVVLVVGAFLFKVGRRSSLREEMICELDIPRRLLSWPTAFSSSLITVSFEEVEAVVYGMTEFPVNKSERAGRVHAFMLLVRDESGRMIPVIEASTDKESTHRVGQLLSQVLKVPIMEVGIGQEDDR